MAKKPSKFRSSTSGKQPNFGVSVETEGLDAVLAKLASAKAEVHRHSAFALGLAARALLRKSMMNAPVKTGKLRNSGRIIEPRMRGEAAYSGVVFDVDYSGTIHERPKGRGRKFLQRAIASEANEMLNLYTIGLKMGDMFEKGQRRSAVKKLATAKKRGVTKNNIKTLGMGQAGGARPGAGRPRGS